MVQSQQKRPKRRSMMIAQRLQFLLLNGEKQSNTVEYHTIKYKYNGIQHYILNCIYNNRPIIKIVLYNAV